jgi:hypothetical protein
MLISALVVFSARDAHALGPVDVEVAARVGSATAPSSAYTNPFGLGLGARAGVSVLGFYGGLSVIDYLGTSTTVSVAGANANASQHALLYGLEAGFGLKVAILTIRPQLGLGRIGITSSTDATIGGLNLSGGQTNGYVYLEPGVVALISLGTVFLGADVNALVVPGVDPVVTGQTDSKTWTSLTIHGQLGVQF